MDMDAGRQIFWRRMAPKLKSLDNADKLMGKKTQKDNNHTGTFS